MAMDKQSYDAQYAKAMRIGATPEGMRILTQAALGQNDDFSQDVANMALHALSKMKIAFAGEQAKKQLAAAGKQTVIDRNIQRAMAEQLPEDQGIGQLPAPNMQALAAADGGVVGYAGGGDVARFEEGGRTRLQMLGDWYSEDALPWVQRKMASAIAPWGSEETRESAKDAWKWLNTAPGKKQEATVSDKATQAPASKTEQSAPASAPAASGKGNPGKATPAAPAADGTPAENPYITGFKAYMDKMGENQRPYFEKMAQHLEEQKQNIAQGRKDALGIMALRAAAGLATPGQAPGLLGLTGVDRAFSGAAEEGGRAINLQQAGQQALTSQYMQMLQLREAAARGDATAALTLQKMEQEAPKNEAEVAYLRSRANYLNTGGSNAAGGNSIEIKRLTALQNNLRVQLANASPSEQKTLKARLAQVGERLSSLNNMPSLSSSINRINTRKALSDDDLMP